MILKIKEEGVFLQARERQRHAHQASGGKVGIPNSKEGSTEAQRPVNSGYMCNRAWGMGSYISRIHFE